VLLLDQVLAFNPRIDTMAFKHKGERAVLYESIAQADIEAKGFDVHASQVDDDEGGHSAIPKWRQEQIDNVKEEEAEDLMDLRHQNPDAYKRKMKKNKKKLKKKEDIYALVKRVESGDNGALDDFFGGDEELQEAAASAAAELEVELPPVYLRRSTISRGGRKGTERWEPTAGADDVADTISELDLDAAVGAAGAGAAGGGGGTAQEKAAGVVGKAWYAGTIERMLCENTVKSCMQGDYLVRKSASSSGYVLCVNDNKSAVNYTISVSGTKFTFTHASFASIDEVVQFAKGTPLKSVARAGQRLVLGHPAILHPWLSIDMDRATSERIVKEAGHGDFLVRLSSSGDKYVLVVNDTKIACSYSITMSPDKQFVFGGQVHASVAEVIEAMKVTAFKSQKTYEMMLANPAKPK